jgi:hypothetical protein
MSVGILGKGIHPLVGNPVGYDDASVRPGDGSLPFPAPEKGAQDQQSGYQSEFHRLLSVFKP